jgi:hypothetical protein
MRGESKFRRSSFFIRQSYDLKISVSFQPQLLFPPFSFLIEPCLFVVINISLAIILPAEL